MRSARAAGIDPAARRWAERYARGDTFELVAREWFDKFSTDWADSHKEKIIRRLELYLFPLIGQRPTAQLSAVDVLTCLRRIEASAKLETAKRASQNCSRIFRYAIAAGRAESNPAEHLRRCRCTAKDILRLSPHQKESVNCYARSMLTAGATWCASR